MLNTTVFHDDFPEVDFRVKVASFLMFQVGKSDLMLFFFFCITPKRPKPAPERSAGVALRGVKKH